EYRVTNHLMFECLIETPKERHTFLGLNEVLVHAGKSFHMIDLDLAVDGETATRYRGDGLILSTPVGSTAHSLSAGGPILGQELSAFVITPICAHKLTNRAVVDSAGKVDTIFLIFGASYSGLIIDGQGLIAVTSAS